MTLHPGAPTVADLLEQVAAKLYRDEPLDPAEQAVYDQVCRDAERADRSPTLVQELDRLIDEQVRVELTGEAGAEAETVTVQLTPTAWAFVMCDADVAIIAGPRREGKTVSAICRMLRVAGDFHRHLTHRLTIGGFV